MLAFVRDCLSVYVCAFVTMGTGLGTAEVTHLSCLKKLKWTCLLLLLIEYNSTGHMSRFRCCLTGKYPCLLPR